jgi:hypothetical protein
MQDHIARNYDIDILTGNDKMVPSKGDRHIALLFDQGNVPVVQAEK